MRIYVADAGSVLLCRQSGVLEAMAAIVDFRLGDVVQLRKLHPCGGDRWLVTRLGADIGIQCQTCRHNVLLTRRDLERRVKQFVSRGEPIHASPGLSSGSLD